MALQLTSPVLTQGGMFPAKYTCNGENVNPPLKISGVPTGAKSLVLLFDDPDAAKEPAGIGKTYDHWIVYNLSTADQQIAEASRPIGAQFGKNSAGNDEYRGPCPPTFKHKYFFRLLALDTKLELGEMPDKAQVEEAARGHILEQAELTAFYEQIK